MFKGKKLIAMIVCLVCILSSTSVFAESATFSDWTARGIPYVSYVKNTAYWTSNHTSVTASDAYQSKSGIFIRNSGATKLSISTSFKVVYNFKNTFLVGAVLSGVTLGYDRDFVDQFWGDAYSCFGWKFDIG